jgi:site-specific DNA-cytosine methylase
LPRFSHTRTHAHTFHRPQKTIDEKGESGQTWRGLVQWVERAKPAIVILENVKKAPWKKKEEIFEKLGYHAKATYVDTKHYYIPQTRQRGYLVAVLKNRGVPANVGQAWIDQIVALKRPTSASLDAFMFSNDDPRVLRGRARLTNGDDEDDNNHSELGQM